MSQFKKKIAMYTAMLAFLSISSASVYAATSADVVGKTSNMDVIDTSSVRTDVNFKDNAGRGAVGQVDWRNFSVGKNEQVNFGFSSVSQTVINRVLGGQSSSILGKLTNSCTSGNCVNNAATGKVILINPAGVMFGAGSMVDLNSFTVSTFDFNGAKNLQNMTDTALNEYQTGTLNKLSPYAAVNGEGRSYGEINFDSNYTEAFDKAGVSYEKGKTQISLDGTTFDHFYDIERTGENNNNKSIALVSDNINYKDSLLRTAMSLNYGDKSFSNVKIVTADGVTFGYLQNGYAYDQKVANDSKTDVVRNISIDNTNIDANKPAIESGEVYINNTSNAAGSNVKISNSVVKADKLVSQENGDIIIVSSHDIDLNHSRLETKNTNVSDADGNFLGDTLSQDGGRIYLVANEDIKAKDSVLLTSGAKDQPEGHTAGKIKIKSYGKDVDLENTRAIAMGDVEIGAAKNVKMDNSLAYAGNDLNASEMNKVEISGSESVKMHNSAVNARGNADIKSVNGDGATNGDITISSDLTADGKNQSVIKVGNKLSIQGKNTKLDNASLVYKDLKFYNDGTTGKNNVTVANNSTFTPLDEAGKATVKTIDIETNGNLTFDNATVQRAGYSIDLAADDGTPDGKQFTARSKTQANVDTLNATSTEGNITVKNNSNITTNKDINMTSKKGSYTQTKSQLTAGNDVNVTAEGDVSVVSGILDDAPGGLLINEAMRAGNDANITSKNGNYDQSVASIVAKKDVNINAKKDVNIEHSAIYADKNVNMDSSKNINISGKIDGSDLKITDITAGNDVNVKAAGKITVSDNSKINAKTGNASLSTTGSKDNGNITISDSKVEAANDVNVKSTKGNKITVKKSNIIAGSDSEGFDVVNDANDTIGDVNIEAKAGSVYISDSSKVLSQDKDVNIIAKNDINFNNIAGEPVNIDKSSQIKAENNVLINSTDGNIRGEKTEMTTIEYGNRLTFDAAKDNEFTSQDSLKSVNVDYVAGNANRFYTQEDIQFVNSSLKAKDNFVESGKDVILNNLEIKTPDGLKSEEVTTQIFANGNVTTDNVTKEDLNAKGPHTFPQSVSTERSGKDKTVLDVGKTKVKITAETVKDPKNPDNGSITLNVKNADNDKAGLELTAQNVDKLDKDPTDGYHKTGYYKSGTQKWDENIDPHEGPEVHLDADDDKVSITSIITDKLTLDDKDTFTAVPDGDNDTAYIEVRDEGGFNFDDHPEFDPDPQGFKYRTSDMDVDKKQQDNWTEWHEIDRKVEVEETDTKITTTTTVTEQRENNPKITEERRAKEHEIEFDSQGNQTKFTLIYDKHDVKTYDGEQQIETRTNVDVQVEEKCPDLPDVDPVIHTPDSLINIVKIPREQAEISKTSKVSDNTVDQTSNIMSAAAKVDLSDAEENENSESEDSSEE